jgi:pimeloyl-ACP methyl ester carboxylesterase
LPSVNLPASDQLEHLRLAAGLAGLAPEAVALPEDRYVQMRGLRFHYLDWGGEGDAIVFLHGGGLTAHTWDLVSLLLRNGYRCIALDQRGHGDTDWSDDLDYGIDAFAADIAAFVDKLGPDRFVLVGQSLGGMAAMAYASSATGEPDGLVLVDVGPEVRLEGANRVADFTMAPADLDSVDDFVERARAFNPRRDPRLLRISLLHNLRRLENGRWTWKYDRRHLSPAMFSVLTRRLADLRKELHRITCPALVVRGAASDVFSDEDAEYAADLLPHGRWIRIEGAGHTVQGDNPKALADELRMFLKRAGLGG